MIIYASLGRDRAETMPEPNCDMDENWTQSPY